MKACRVKANKLSGTNYKELHKKARYIYDQIKKRSKRKPYVRSAYFKKDKIFLDLFWSHLFEKNHFGDFTRRLKFYPCAIELIRHSNLEPASKENVGKRSEILHRFAGITGDSELFYVQIKETKRTGKKWFISVFPVQKNL